MGIPLIWDGLLEGLSGGLQDAAMSSTQVSGVTLWQQGQLFLHRGGGKREGQPVYQIASTAGGRV